MSATCFPLEFLQTADARRLVTYLVEEVTDTQAGLDAMTWLLANRPAVANEVLCLVYDVACYPVADVFPEQTQDLGKWFASVPVESELPVDKVPCAATESDVHAAAVAAMGLREKFFGAECAAA